MWWLRLHLPNHWVTCLSGKARGWRAEVPKPNPEPSPHAHPHPSVAESARHHTTRFSEPRNEHGTPIGECGYYTYMSIVIAIVMEL